MHIQMMQTAAVAASLTAFARAALAATRPAGPKSRGPPGPAPVDGSSVARSWWMCSGLRMPMESTGGGDVEGDGGCRDRPGEVRRVAMVEEKKERAKNKN